MVASTTRYTGKECSPSLKVKSTDQILNFLNGTKIIALLVDAGDSRMPSTFEHHLFLSHVNRNTSREIPLANGTTPTLRQNSTIEKCQYERTNARLFRLILSWRAASPRHERYLGRTEQCVNAFALP